MKGWIRGTRGRLTIAFAGVLLLAVVIADTAIAILLTQAEMRAAGDVLVSQASTIASGIEDVNGEVRFGTEPPTETSQGIAVHAAIVSSDGAIARTSGQGLSRSDLLKLAADALKRSGPAPPVSERDTHGVPWLAYAQPLQTGQAAKAVLIVSRSVGELQSSLAQTVLTVSGVSLLLVVAGTFLAYRLAGRILLPVRQIAGTARSLSERDLHRRVEVDVPPDELGELVQTFNGMLERLEASFDSLRRFTADASHELRSPLALMRSEIEGTLARPRTPDSYVDVLRGLEAEVEHMTRMVDQLLILARADAGALHPAFTQVDVADFLHESAARWAPAAGERQVRIEVEAPDSGTLNGDPSLLRRVMDNLLDNAVGHAPAGSAVVIKSAQSDRGWWWIDVKDDGPGIPPAARETLFERFQRVDGVRARENGGAGLGLALSRAIIQAHRGHLDLVDDPGVRGADFRLTLRNGSPLSE